MKDFAHLIRLAVLFGVAIAGFALVRQALAPRSFGDLGHFRGDVLKEIRAGEPVFAGKEACLMCHDEPGAKLAAGPHKGLSCEGCHGAQAKHAADPSSGKPQFPAAAPLCKGCHEANSAKPARFPQVVSAEHSGGVDCDNCHTPHSPAP